MRARLVWVMLALLLAVPAAGFAATEDPEPEEPEQDAATSSYFETVTVTATGSEVDTFEIAAPVTVIKAEEIARKPVNNAADLLREQPGVDVNGVGTTQPRPIIRGLRGLRVLFMENGLRLNNPRRQTDFGEITGLVDLDGAERVEVVRGPASVLYGSDAIGGVLNLVSREPSFSGGQRFGGTFGLRFSEADDQLRTHIGLDGVTGPFAYDVGATFRDAENYNAPDGKFGDIVLTDPVPVTDTGAEDDTISGSFAFRLAETQSLTFRFNRYRADQSGFGFVDPVLIGDSEDFRIRITYPFQDFDRYTLSYRANELSSPMADTVKSQLYYQKNERELSNDIDINIGPIFPGAPDSSVEIDTLNFTELETWGLRTEVVKTAGGRHLLTYGFEASQDDSFNTDNGVTTTTLRFPGPPFEVIEEETDDLANAPNATNTSWGVFVQDEIRATDRFSVNLGARFQQVETEAEPTPGWDISELDFEDDSVVGAAGLVFRVNDNLRLVGSFGTAFRAPNIIERLFNGPTPEGSGYQILNPGLVSEESDNIEAGLKYRRSNVYFEVLVFQNDIEDGIIQDFLSEDEIAALPQDVRDEIEALEVDFVVQQRNVDKLRYEGVEVGIGYQFPVGVAIEANYTHIDGERQGQSAVPIENSFSNKVNLVVRYEPSSERYWLEYRVRHNGDADVAVDPDEPLPLIGATLPSFTVHSIGGGVRLKSKGVTHDLGLAIENLTDELYAEFSNATFFRPQPERSIVGSYRLRF